MNIQEIAKKAAEEGLPVIHPLPDPAKLPPVDGAIAVCGACGLRIKPIMGYVCNNPRCGVFPRVTYAAGTDSYASALAGNPLTQRS